MRDPAGKDGGHAFSTRACWAPRPRGRKRASARHCSGCPPQWWARPRCWHPRPGWPRLPLRPRSYGTCPSASSSTTSSSSGSPSDYSGGVTRSSGTSSAERRWGCPREAGEGDRRRSLYLGALVGHHKVMTILELICGVVQNHRTRVSPLRSMLYFDPPSLLGRSITPDGHARFTYRFGEHPDIFLRIFGSCCWDKSYLFPVCLMNKNPYRLFYRFAFLVLSHFLQYNNYSLP